MQSLSWRFLKIHFSKDIFDGYDGNIQKQCLLLLFKWNVHKFCWRVQSEKAKNAGKSICNMKNSISLLNNRKTCFYKLISSIKEEKKRKIDNFHRFIEFQQQVRYTQHQQFIFRVKFSMKIKLNFTLLSELAHKRNKLFNKIELKLFFSKSLT